MILQIYLILKTDFQLFELNFRNGYTPAVPDKIISYSISNISLHLLLYIKQLWIKIERDISVVNAKRQMQEIIDHVKIQPGNKTIQLAIDVDPI